MGKLSDNDQKILDSLIDPDRVQQAKYAWDDNYQRRLMGMLLTDTYFLVQSQALIKPDFFTSEVHVAICNILFSYFEKYKSIPERFILAEELREKVKDRDDKIRLYYQTELSSLYEYYVPGIATREVLLDKLTVFAKAQALKVAFHASLTEIGKAPEDDGTWIKVNEILRQAMTVDRHFDIGFQYFPKLEEMFKKMAERQEIKERFTSGFSAIDDAYGMGTLCRGEVYSWIGMPGSGKTHKKDTLILMFDGTVKKVQDVVVGDLVMGDDSTPRKVLSTHNGYGELYEVRPIKGDSYYVNGPHILSLKNADGELVNISVEDWFKQCNYFKITVKGWRVGVDFPNKDVFIDPYILGIWLGDGDENSGGFLKKNNFTVKQFIKDANQRGLLWKVNDDNYITYKDEDDPGSFYHDLKHYSLIGNKHIPFDYKVNDRKSRLNLLAGLVDSMGRNTYYGYEISQRSKSLAEDILFLARSLGFGAYLRVVRRRFCVSLIGNCMAIPTKLKKTTHRQVKDHLLTVIRIFPAGEGEFYGFETDGNHLFLLADFTVVHNSLALVKTAVENCRLGHKVLYITLEMDWVGISQRFTSQFMGKPINKLMQHKAEIIDLGKLYVNGMEDNNILVVRQFPSGELDINTFRAYLNQLELYKFKPDVVILDYVGEMKDLPNMPTWESKYRILRTFRGLADIYQFCGFTCVQPNKSAAELSIAEYIDEGNIGSSFDQFKPLDGFWSLNQLTLEKDAGVGRGFVIKHRNGRSRFPFFLRFDYDILNMHEISQDRYKMIMNERGERTAGDINIDGVKSNKRRKRFNPEDNDIISPRDGE